MCQMFMCLFRPLFSQERRRNRKNVDQKLGLGGALPIPWQFRQFLGEARTYIVVPTEPPFTGVSGPPAAEIAIKPAKGVFGGSAEKCLKVPAKSLK